MFIYTLELAWRSFQKKMAMSVFMVLCMSFGVCAAMTGYAYFHALHTNPLQAKDDKIFLLQTDFWRASEIYPHAEKNFMPEVLSYRDASYFLRSDFPYKKTAITSWGGLARVAGNAASPVMARARIATHDYFEMFNVEFLYGQVWSVSADYQAEDVIVISEEMSLHFFDVANSVGKTIIFEGTGYQVVGVIKNSSLESLHVQDIDTETSRINDHFILPFGLMQAREIFPWRGAECPELNADLNLNYRALLDGSCGIFTFWVEFSSPQQKSDFESQVANYIRAEKTFGRYPRPLHYQLSKISEKLAVKHSGKVSMLITFGGCLMLAICMLSCVVMMLAKFFQSTDEVAMRRALGASRAQIFALYIAEGALIGVLGGLLGTLLTFFSLSFLQKIIESRRVLGPLFPENEPLWFTMDAYLVSVAVISAVLASIAAAFYPAWRVCRISITSGLSLL